MAERSANVPITKLISTGDPKQPFLMHVLPSVRCWENSSSTRSHLIAVFMIWSRKRITVMTLEVTVKGSSEGCIYCVSIRLRPGGCQRSCGEKKLRILFLET